MMVDSNVFSFKGLLCFGVLSIVLNLGTLTNHPQNLLLIDSLSRSGAASDEWYDFRGLHDKDYPYGSRFEFLR